MYGIVVCTSHYATQWPKTQDTKENKSNYFARIFMIKCQLENIIIEGKQEVSMDTNDRTGFNH